MSDLLLGGCLGIAAWNICHAAVSAIVVALRGQDGVLSWPDVGVSALIALVFLFFAVLIGVL